MSSSLIAQQFQVTYSYVVHFTRSLFDPANPLLADVLARDGGTGPRRILCVLDAGVASACPQLAAAIGAYATAHAHLVQLAGPVQVVPGGEDCKNQPALVQQLLEAVNHYNLDRHAYLAVVGGGAVLDLAGYVAATAHRGVRLLRVPTTVLAQNDSGIGVKNSINAFGKKNFLGTFAPPYAVFNDKDFLLTLTDRDWRGGMAEAVKVALIKDGEFFAFLEAQAAQLAARDLGAMRTLIYRCAELHLQHIAGADPFEQGSSRPLDFGHWAAHKLEQLSSYRLRHGEAVAIGIALDAAYSHLQGHLPAEALHRILNVLHALGFALHTPEMDQHLADANHADSLLHGLQEFREHLGGQLTIMLLAGLGQGLEVHAVDAPHMAAAGRYLRHYQRTHTASRPLLQSA
jgi:3-dehydroquinate synthase